jgi:hypothetical protein
MINENMNRLTAEIALRDPTPDNLARARDVLETALRSRGMLDEGGQHNDGRLVFQI